MMSYRRIYLIVFFLLPTWGCSTNPATGQNQLSFYGAESEIKMGQQADESIIRSLGLHPDEELQNYVSELGLRLAASSERPDLPWTFRVVDSPIVNAFALPGGYIYITRGMLLHLNSEAQLAAVLGHEIGHVTGRHSVEQMSRAQLAQAGMIVAAIASEDVRRYGAYAQQGLGLLFLKFGRDDETEADHLGLRYMTRQGYNPWEMESVFQTLDHTSARSELNPIPDWISTHPSPEDRMEEINNAIGSLPSHARQGLVARSELLDHIDGMIYGDDPREGYFVGRDFYHPEMAFLMSFPPGWSTVNEKSRALAVSPDGNGVVMLSSGKGATAEEAESAFFAEKGVRREGLWVNGFHRFTAGPVSGVVGFIDHEGHVLEVVGFGRDGGFSRYRSSIEAAITSLRPLDDPYYLDVEPARIELVSIPTPMSFRDFDKAYPNGIEIDEAAVLNGLPDATGHLEAGVVKRVLPGRSVGSTRGDKGGEW